MNKRTKFLTAEGNLIDFANFDESLVSLKDIAHHLANERRYGGALGLDQYYSVACHSLNMMSHVYERMAVSGASAVDVIEACRYTLLHDVSEAYLKDIPSGLKSMIPDYKQLETKITNIIFNKYDIVENKFISDTIDKRILLDEVRVLRKEHYEIYHNDVGLEPLGCAIRVNSNPTQARDLFLKACEFFGLSD